MFSEKKAWAPKDLSKAQVSVQAAGQPSTEVELAENSILDVELVIDGNSAPQSDPLQSLLLMRRQLMIY